MPHVLRRVRFAAATVLLGLLLLTAWSVTRSDALGEAEGAYARARDPKGLALALELALAHLDRQPWSRQASLIAARCLSRLDYLDEADRYYGDLGRLGLSDKHLRAYAILRANRRDEAVDAYRAILLSHPEDVEAARILGGIYYSRKQYDEALEAADRLISNPRGKILGHQLAATVYHDDNLPGQAVDQFEHALELDPDLESIPPDARTVFWLSFTSDLLQIGRADDARRHLTRLIAQRPEEPWMRAELGRAASQLGDFDQAEREWTRVAEQRPEAAEPWYELARVALARTPPDPAKAAEFLERADSLVPSDYRVLYLLRNAYLRLGRKADAEALNGRIELARPKAKQAPGGMGPRSSGQP
jgi:tetratricopeptide (TPR) repeat protein